jgi:pyrroloquinoline quinone (PQQ) biosynthesis protein C
MADDRIPGLEQALANAMNEAWQQRHRAEAAERARNTALAEIDAAWDYISHGYAIESREELEQAAKTNGFKYGLAQAMHHIWKRLPIIGDLLADRDARQAERDAALARWEKLKVWLHSVTPREFKMVEAEMAKLEQETK